MKHSKGFTIIELLVAMLVLMFVMMGFLLGILNYIKFSLDARMKDTASRAIRDWSGYLESLPYKAKLIEPNTYHNNWDNASCNPPVNCDPNHSDCPLNCTFEDTNNANNDSDNDNIPDFYDPYNGDNNNFKNNPTNTANWLFISPTTNCINCPPRQYKVGNRTVYVGITIAKLTHQGREMGKAFGITAWYFSPIDEKYKYVSTTLIKRKP